MALSDQDIDIILLLINTDKLTTYAISQETGISIPQVQYRINKLIDCQVINSEQNGKKKLYDIHPALKSNKIIDEITTNLKEISDTIDQIKYTSPEGMKAIIGFIIERVTFFDNFETSEFNNNSS